MRSGKKKTDGSRLRPWRRPGLTALIASVLAISGLWAPPLAGAAPGDAGPLDPLTAAEIGTTRDVIEASNKYLPGSFFPIVTLKEPPKAELLAWDPGEPFRREAFANVYNREANRLFEAVVDLKTQKLMSWVERPGVQPAVSISEYAQADAVVRADARWRKAIRDRGLKPADIYIDVWAPGSVALPPNPSGQAASARSVVLRRWSPEPVRSSGRGRGRDGRHERPGRSSTSPTRASNP